MWPLVVILSLLVFGCTDPGPDPAPEPGTPSDTEDPDLPNPLLVEVLVRADGLPVEGATVLQGGSLDHVLTGPDGRVSIELDTGGDREIWLVAALPDHRSRGFEVAEVPSGVIEFDLSTVEQDNPDYVFGDPGLDEGDSTKHCSHCHVPIAVGFAQSQHAEAARDPLVHDLFAGVAGALADAASCAAAGGRWLPGTLPAGLPADRCYLGEGVLPAIGPDCGAIGQLACDDPALPEPARPEVFGQCADCHAPAVDGPVGGGHSLLGLPQRPYEFGVHCDFCHKVRAVDPTLPPGRGGRLVLGRPLEPGSAFAPFLPVMYGPYPDVINGFMGGTYTPMFSTSTFCSGCHEYAQGGDEGTTAPADLGRWPEGALPIHTTWSEWAASPFATVMQCQSCHMPALDVPNAADLDPKGASGPGLVSGFLREPGTVRSHRFLGALDVPEQGPPLVDTAAALELVVAEDATAPGHWDVEVEVRNVGAGHALPTGEPMRSLVLWIDARGCDGIPLPQVGGDVVTPEGFALARGTVGEDFAFDTDGTCVDCVLSSLDFAAAAAAEGGAGLVVRVLRDSGESVDYDGVPPFDTLGFPPEDKGLPRWLPIDAVPVEAVLPTGLRLLRPLAAEPGDLVLLGHERASDAGPYAALAGAPGLDFQRVLADSSGRTPVPHHLAVDVVRDNRIPAGAATSVHARFSTPEGCETPEVRASLFYRRHTPGLARERRWAGAVERQIATAP